MGSFARVKRVGATKVWMVAPEEGWPGWPLVSVVVGHGHVLDLPLRGGGLLLWPGNKATVSLSPSRSHHCPCCDGLEPGLKLCPTLSVRRLRVSVETIAANQQGQRPRCWALPRSLSACLRKRQENGQVNAWLCCGCVLRVREKIPHFSSLETINHQIDSEAAWLSAIRGNLQ